MVSLLVRNDGEIVWGGLVGRVGHWLMTVLRVTVSV